MEMIKVESSQIDAICWKRDLLFVRFNTGAVYCYSDVSYDVYKEMLDSSSKGHYLNAEIKNTYPAIKLSK